MMEIPLPMRIRASHSLSSPSPSAIYQYFTSSSSSHPSPSFRTHCSRKSPPPPQNGDGDEEGNTSRGDKSMDWDKAWSNFSKQGKKKTPSSKFSPDKYVSWNPRPSNYPPSEEVDPIKRTERSNLSLWTSQTFTLAVGVAIITLLLIYTILAPVK
ncbi:hypothetical protein Dimus_034603 [Dionaea muscipula]